jgi:uncharacterized BrkB/YihY/UPF0761 family membrane protein
VATFQLCQLTVSNAIPKASKPAEVNTHQLKDILYAKFTSQLRITYQVIGVDITKAMATHFKKSLFNILITSVTLAPFIFLMPISLVLALQTKMVKPNKPAIPSSTHHKAANSMNRVVLTCLLFRLLIV